MIGRSAKVTGLLNTSEAAEHLGMSQSWLEHKRAAGEGPQFVRMGGRCMYRLEDLHRYIDANLSTAE